MHKTKLEKSLPDGLFLGNENKELLTKAIDQYHAHGLTIVAISNKKPIEPWKQLTPRTGKEFIDFHTDSKLNGIAVIQGKPNDEGYAQFTFDFDLKGKEVFKAFKYKAKEQGITLNNPLVVSTNKGVHVTIWAKPQDMRDALNDRPYILAKSKDAKVIIEIRGENNLITKPLSWGSNNHRYTSNKDFEGYPIDGWTSCRCNTEQLKALIAIAEWFNEFIDAPRVNIPSIADIATSPQDDSTGQGQAEGHQEATSKAKGISGQSKAITSNEEYKAHNAARERFNAEHPIEDLLTKYGYTGDIQKGWIRPGGTSNHSIKYDRTDGKITHFSTNDEKHGLKSDSFDVFVKHECDGDYKEGYRRIFTMYSVPEDARTSHDDAPLAINEDKLEQAQELEERWRKPIDLSCTKAWQQMPKALKDAYMGIQTINNGFDTGITFFATLTLAGSMVMAKSRNKDLRYHLSGSNLYPNLWMVGLAASGEGKSPLLHTLAKKNEDVLEALNLTIAEESTPRAMFCEYGYQITKNTKPAKNDEEEQKREEQHQAIADKAKSKPAVCLIMDEIGVSMKEWHQTGEHANNTKIITKICDSTSPIRADTTAEIRRIDNPAFSCISMSQPAKWQQFVTSPMGISLDNQGFLKRLIQVTAGDVTTGQDVQDALNALNDADSRESYKKAYQAIERLIELVANANPYPKNPDSFIDSSHQDYNHPAYIPEEQALEVFAGRVRGENDFIYHGWNDVLSYPLIKSIIERYGIRIDEEASKLKQQAIKLALIHQYIKNIESGTNTIICPDIYKSYLHILVRMKIKAMIANIINNVDEEQERLKKQIVAWINQAKDSRLTYGQIRDKTPRYKGKKLNKTELTELLEAMVKQGMIVRQDQVYISKSII